MGEPKSPKNGRLHTSRFRCGREVRAWRTRRLIAGALRDVVVLFSPQLYEGQLRGLHQSLERSRRELEKMGCAPRLNAQAAKRKLDKIRSPQYLRSLLAYELEHDPQGALTLRLWCDSHEYQRLLSCYFGLRILITDRQDWSTAQIIEAYRRQAKAEAAFRDLKDPQMLATRPQFHWTDQKLQVHAFMCVTAYLLLSLLHRRAEQQAAYQGSARRLLAELAEVRCCRLIEVTGRQGRPRVRWQIEEIDPERQALVQALGAVPTLP